VVLFFCIALLPGCLFGRGKQTDAKNVLHPDADVRRETVQAISQVRTDDSVSVLTDRLLKDPDPLVRAQAAAALGRVRDPKSVPYLLEALKDTQAVVRWDACVALGLLRDPASLDPMVQVLRTDDSVDVRRAAARTLGLFRDERAVPPLIDATGDSEPGVAKAAAVALLEMTGQSFGRDREGWKKWWDAHGGAAAIRAPGPVEGTQ